MDTPFWVYKWLRCVHELGWVVANDVLKTGLVLSRGSTKIEPWRHSYVIRIIINDISVIRTIWFKITDCNVEFDTSNYLFAPEVWILEHENHIIHVTYPFSSIYLKIKFNLSKCFTCKRNNWNLPWDVWKSMWFGYWKPFECGITWIGENLLFHPSIEIEEYKQRNYQFLSYFLINSFLNGLFLIRV